MSRHHTASPSGFISLSTPAVHQGGGSTGRALSRRLNAAYRSGSLPREIRALSQAKTFALEVKTYGLWLVYGFIIYTDNLSLFHFTIRGERSSADVSCFFPPDLQESLCPCKILCNNSNVVRVLL